MRDRYVITKYIIDAIRELEPMDMLSCFVAVFRYLDDGTIPEHGIERALVLMAQEELDRQDRMLSKFYGRTCPEYVEWRNAVFKRDGYTCQRCGKHGGKLNAHHIVPYSRSVELRYDVSNGVTLCEECHREAHHGKKQPDPE